MTIHTLSEINGISGPVLDTDDAKHGAAISYLLSYGWAKTMADCVGGIRKSMAAEGATEDEIIAKLAEVQTARRDAILAGEIGTKGGSKGPRKVGDARLLDLVTLDYATRQGVVFPAKKSEPLRIGSREFADTQAALLAFQNSPKHRPAIDAEVATRRNAKVEVESIDF